MMGKAMNSSAFTTYWRTVWSGITTTCLGLTLTGRYLFRRPVTRLYPEARPPIPDGHRGLHCYEIDKCTACMACLKACPVDCIEVESEGKGKNAEVKAYRVDYAKCLFCNLCCEACPTDCLWLGPDWDLSAYERAGCRANLVGLNSDYVQSQKYPSLIAAEEAKKKAQDAKKKAATAKAAEAAAEKKAAADDQPKQDNES
ncbi:4Fe-4S binding protein [Candidatus Sumerlaeota bacterium]